LTDGLTFAVNERRASNHRLVQIGRCHFEEELPGFPASLATPTQIMNFFGLSFDSSVFGLDGFVAPNEGFIEPITN